MGENCFVLKVKTKKKKKLTIEQFIVFEIPKYIVRYNPTKFLISSQIKALSYRSINKMVIIPRSQI